ncbi:hypothetical protein B0T21DRAFT_344635 [Apiosordaria backusii]|uniref:Uncharacterized protein n=1 Tax=Apiosordaria backusii TaxID=314023 RepID=A0AA40ERY7_9PEZI|nr:hypothetical protein B0T21DRAFT_344635 [Apiosordaria backusii]
MLYKCLVVGLRHQMLKRLKYFNCIEYKVPVRPKFIAKYKGKESLPVSYPVLTEHPTLLQGYSKACILLTTAYRLYRSKAIESLPICLLGYARHRISVGTVEQKYIGQLTNSILKKVKVPVRPKFTAKYKGKESLSVSYPALAEHPISLLLRPTTIGTAYRLYRSEAIEGLPICLLGYARYQLRVLGIDRNNVRKLATLAPRAS